MNFSQILYKAMQLTSVNDIVIQRSCFEDFHCCFALAKTCNEYIKLCKLYDPAVAYERIFFSFNNAISFSSLHIHSLYKARV